MEAVSNTVPTILPAKKLCFHLPAARAVAASPLQQTQHTTCSSLYYQSVVFCSKMSYYSSATAARCLLSQNRYAAKNTAKCWNTYFHVVLFCTFMASLLKAFKNCY